MNALLLRTIAVSLLFSVFLTIKYYTWFVEIIGVQSLYGFLLAFHFQMEKVADVMGTTTVIPTLWFSGVFGFSLYASSIFYPMLERLIIDLNAYLAETGGRVALRLREKKTVAK